MKGRRQVLDGEPILDGQRGLGDDLAGLGRQLGQFLHIGTAAGWGMHAMIGLVLAAIYAALLAGRLPGAPALRGATFGFAVFLVAQVVVTPMMGGGVFSGGNMAMIGGSLMGHLVYGGVVGAIFGTVGRVQLPRKL